jgi:hypothetical protein
MAGERHGMCELTRHSMAGERHGMCELALVHTLALFFNKKKYELLEDDFTAKV